MASNKMKTKIAVYGTGNYAYALVKWIQYRKIAVSIMFFIQSSLDKDKFLDIPIYSYKHIESEPDIDYLVLAVSDKYMEEVRKNLQTLQMIDGIQSRIVTIDEFKKAMGHEEDVPIVIEEKQDVGLLERIGSNYGGYWIVPTMLRESPVVFSFGIGEEISFDLGMIEKFGAKVYAFDPTPKAISFMQQYRDNGRIVFAPVGIATSDGTAMFYLPKNTEYVSGSQDSREELEAVPIEVAMNSFSTIIKKLGIKEEIDIVKMDIEGSEFDVLPDVLNCSNVDIRQILVEFHERFYPDGISKKNKVLKLLISKGYNLAFEDRLEYTMTFIKE